MYLKSSLFLLRAEAATSTWEAGCSSARRAEAACSPPRVAEVGAGTLPGYPTTILVPPQNVHQLACSIKENFSISFTTEPFSLILQISQKTISTCISGLFGKHSGGPFSIFP